MTEEENKAIETLQYLCSDDCINKDIIKIIVNLIEKLQKEIEEKTIIIMAGAEKVKQLEKEFIIKQEVKENYIPKDKIREKLEKIEKEKEQYYAAGQHLMYMLLKNQLKSLLEEE